MHPNPVQHPHSFIIIFCIDAIQNLEKECLRQYSINIKPTSMPPKCAK